MTMILRTIDYHFSGWDEIYFLQAALRLRGYDVPVNGMWKKDDVTTQAVIAFQKYVNIRPSGVVDKYTWDKLLERW